MSVHYKFKSALEYDTVTFDGLHISVKDLKNSIIQQKRIGKNTDFDLQVTNAQTKEIYEDENALIPKNTSLLIARIPIISQNKSKSWEGYGGDATPPSRVDEGGPIAKAVDLSNLDVPEDDKIRAMMSQSTQDYDPSNYMKIRGANQMGVVPPNYRCYKCHQSGHWIKDCPLSQGPEPIEIKKSTGIPRSFMVPVEGPQVQGAMMTPNGSYAVPVLDHQAYTQKQQPAPVLQEEKPEIPEDLLCSICSDLLTDAVMIPCCGNSFCDECIRSCLLESEDHECPDCHDRDISPGTLIPNRFLRNSVANFKNTTGYVKRSVYKPPLKPVVIEDVQTKLPENNSTVTPEVDVKEKEVATAATATTVVPKKDAEEEKTVISEADSTEPPKVTTSVDFSKDIDITEQPAKVAKSPTPEGPPGVSPKRESSTKSQPITNMANTTRSYSSNSSRYGHGQKSSHDRSPRKQLTHHQSPSYPEPQQHMEERPGTPTVDEPGMGANILGAPGIYPSVSVSNAYNSAPPPGIMPPMMGMGPAPHMQGPPPSMTSQYTGGPPPGVYSQQPQGPMPNFRLPPPNSGSTPYMPPGPYNVPSRPMFDTSRPPMQGPPGYPPNYNMSQRLPRGRDYIPSQSRGIRGKTPPGIIDDPLEAFNRMLREKDERERRAKWRKGRNYSRSSSRSRSRSRSRTPVRMRSRSPRRRFSRSRSRSFSLSRSRSRSFSPSVRGSPSFRDFSPRHSPRRGGQTRYRSPIRSPPRYRYKDPVPSDRHRDRDVDRDRDRDRDYANRGDRGYSREQERHYYDSFERDRNRPKHLWNQGTIKGPPDGHYQPEMQAPYLSRYPPRDNYPPFLGKNESPHHMPSFQHPHQQPPPLHVPQRRYDDVVPPGTEQPPVPGLELTPRFDDRFSYEQENIPVERYESPVRDYRDKEVDKRNEREKDRDREKERDRDRERDRERVHTEKSRDQPLVEKYKERRYDRHSRSPERTKKDNKDNSDDEKTKRSKEKKKKKEKKESDKKKRKEKKEKREHDKHKKIEEREKKSKEVPAKSESQQPAAKPETEDVKKEVKKEVKKDLEVKSEKSQKEMSPHEDSNDVNKNEMVPENDKPVEEPQTDLYGDILTDGIDNNVVANYGKIEEKTEDVEPKVDKPVVAETPPKTDEIELKTVDEANDDYEKDVLELHTNEAELKVELEINKTDLLVPIPEKSRWEIDEEPAQTPTTPTELIKMEAKLEKSGKVTNEVLKRAENAIFAKAINAIRPIEIKKISLDRAKLYSGEKDKKLDEMDMRNIQVTISSNYSDDIHPPGTEPKHMESSIQPPVRLSVKERLGCKVDDLDRIVKVDKSYDRNRSCSLSPLSKRANEGARNYSQGERRIEVEERRRQEDKSRHGSSSRHHRSYRSTAERSERTESRSAARKDVRETRRDDYNSSRRDSRRDRDLHRRDDGHRRDERKNTDTHHKDDKKSTQPSTTDDAKRDKRKRTRSKSVSRDKRERSKSKKKDKRQKKEKVKKHKKDEGEDAKEKSNDSKDKKSEASDLKPPKPVTDRRKPTLDEASFEPDYDLESESEKDDDKEKAEPKKPVSKSPEPEKKKIKLEEKKKASSSSDSSDSSSAEDRKKKKHKKHKKKKSRKDSSSSSSESDSESTDEDKSKKRKKHKKKIKKKKKSKHK